MLRSVEFAFWSRWDRRTEHFGHVTFIRVRLFPRFVLAIPNLGIGLNGIWVDRLCYDEVSQASWASWVLLLNDVMITLRWWVLAVRSCSTGIGGRDARA